MRTLAALPRGRSGPAQIWLLHAANLLYLAIVISSWALAGASQGAPPAWLDRGLAGILAQLGFFLLPALAFLWLTRQPPRAALKLNPLSLGSAARCFLVGLLSWAGFAFCSSLTTALLASLQLPGPSQAAVAAGSSDTPWAFLVMVVAVAPLCEELLFRGVLLHAYELRVGAHAIWLVALLFALVHLSVEQMLGAFFVGLIAGWVVYRTRSLWAGVLVHLGTNLLSALLLLLSLAVSGEVAEAAQGAPPASELLAMLWSGVLVWGAITAVVLVPMFFLLRSLGRRYPTPTPVAAQLDLHTLWSFALSLVVAAALLILSLFR
ncbi:MAG: CPBP family intramembrane metalloprotease [Chloroflexales bacterium]|nr:CPBP family intramembrane metalloprotease [Chloroflexales bacterium]